MKVSADKLDNAILTCKPLRMEMSRFTMAKLLEVASIDAFTPKTYRGVPINHDDRLNFGEIVFWFSTKEKD